MQSIYSQEVITGLNISNSPPILIQDIPNQSWPSGVNLMNAFDLDDYFEDPNEDPLVYSYSSVENISVIISSGKVSFFPDEGFVGNRNITFYASDSSANVPSNLVFLFVGTDEEPPQWANPTKNRATVYQSMYINFTTLWTDNIALKNFYFSIMQGSNWVNYPSVNFSGTSNISKYQVQISAAPGSSVYWKFCAYDTTLNLNCTEIQNFSIAQRAIPPSPISPPSHIAADYTAISRIFREEPIENFTINPSLFKVSLKQGTTETRVVRITNVGSLNMSFNLSIVDVEKMVFLSDVNFTIPPGESKDITIDFVASLSTPPSQYFGFIKVDGSETKYIPIVVDVNALELKFGVQLNVPEEYKTLMPGEVVKANISILNLRDVIQEDMTLYIAIKDFYGNIYDSSQEKFVFNASLFLERNFTLPEEIPEGPYIFYARAVTENELALDSDTFEVGSEFTFLASLRSSFIFLLIFILCFVALVLMVVYSRSKEKERILSLYLMLNELKNAIKEEKFDQAVDLYVRVKRVYGEPVSRAALKDREKLKEDIKALSLKLKSKVEDIEAKEKKAKAEPKKQEPAKKIIPTKKPQPSPTPPEKLPAKQEPAKKIIPTKKPQPSPTPPEKTIARKEKQKEVRKSSIKKKTLEKNEVK